MRERSRQVNLRVAPLASDFSRQNFLGGSLERARETERQRDGQRDGQRDRQRDGETERERQRDGQRDRHRQRAVDLRATAGYLQGLGDLV